MSTTDGNKPTTQHPYLTMPAYNRRKQTHHSTSIPHHSCVQHTETNPPLNIHTSPCLHATDENKPTTQHPYLTMPAYNRRKQTHHSTSIPHHACIQQTDPVSPLPTLPTQQPTLSIQQKVTTPITLPSPCKTILITLPSPRKLSQSPSRRHANNPNHPPVTTQAIPITLPSPCKQS